MRDADSDRGWGWGHKYKEYIGNSSQVSCEPASALKIFLKLLLVKKIKVNRKLQLG
jgi:hypothetical protein